MFNLFKEDAARWLVPQQVAPLSEVTLKRVLKLLYLYIPLRAMLAFRIGTWLIGKRVPFFKGVLYRHLFHHYGLELAVDIEIGGGFYIAHPAGSVISPKRLGCETSGNFPRSATTCLLEQGPGYWAGSASVTMP